METPGPAVPPPSDADRIVAALERIAEALDVLCQTHSETAGLPYTPGRRNDPTRGNDGPTEEQGTRA